MLKRHLLRPWGAALLLFVGLFFGQTRSVFADARQWQREGIIVRQGHHIEWQRNNYRNALGYTLVVWSDTRNGDRDVYGQLISPDGSSLWNSTGQPIISYPVYRQEDPDVAATSDNMWIVAWIEFRNDSTGDVWAQKLNNQGVPQWDSAGMLVDEFPSVTNELSVRCVSDGQGGAIVAWEDTRRGDPGDIYAQRITSSGTRAWANPLAVTDIIGDQVGITADADGQGNMVLAWNDKRVASNQNIYAAKITPQGTLPWGGVNGRLVCGATGEQGGAKICPDGTGGAYIAWQDRSNGASNDLNLMHFNTNGDPFDANWPTDCGLVLCNAAEDQSGVRIATSFNGATPDGCVAVWEDVRVNGSINEVYSQKISPTAQMLWGTNGFKVIGDADTSGGGHTRDGVRLTTDLAGGLVCAWEDTRDGEWITCDLYAQRVLANGTLGWQTSGVLIANAPGQQFAPLLRPDANGNRTLVVWDDTRLGSQRISYQQLNNTNGSLTLPDQDGVEIVYGLDGDCRNPQSIDLTMGRVAIVWSDNRLVTGGDMLYYQILDTLAYAQFEQNGTPAAPHNETSNQANQKEHQLCTDGDNGFFVSFQDQRSGIQLIRLQHINRQGFVTADSAGTLVFNSTSDQSNAFVAYDGAGGCYVAWSGFDANFAIDVYVMRCDQNCHPMWAQPVRLTQTDDDDIMSGLVSNPDGCCIATWKSGSFGEFNISGARVCQDGTVAWNRAVCNANGVQEQPTIVADGQGGAYFAWADERDPNNNKDIFAQHLNASGTDIWGSNGIPVYTGANIQNQPAITRDTNGNLYVIWNDFRSGVHLDLYGQKLNTAGARQWPTSGKVLCSVVGDQDDQFPIMEWGDGIYTFWTDNRDYFSDIYGAHFNSSGNLANNYWRPDSGGVINNAYQNQFKPTAADDGHGGAIVSWEDQRASGKEPLVNIWAQWINDYTVSVDEIPHVAIPQVHKLEQNYPNPFNPSTQIVFAIPQTEKVEMFVYNSLGQQVAKLVDKVMTAGTYRVDFASSRIASGQYYYELRTPNFKEIKKMTVLK